MQLNSHVCLRIDNHIFVMQDSTNDDIMVQGVTDEEKTFDSNEFGNHLFLPTSV